MRKSLLRRRLGARAPVEVTQALTAAFRGFEQDRCPGVPTWVLEGGERFWGKDRVQDLAARLRERLGV